MFKLYIFFDNKLLFLYNELLVHILTIQKFFFGETLIPDILLLYSSLVRVSPSKTYD